MDTIFDWITVGIFAFLVTLFLHRSVDVAETKDSLWQYLLASAGCALTNWLGNEGWQAAAVATLTATVAFIVYALRPFGFPPLR